MEIMMIASLTNAQENQKKLLEIAEKTQGINERIHALYKTAKACRIMLDIRGGEEATGLDEGARRIKMFVNLGSERRSKSAIERIDAEAKALNSEIAEMEEAMRSIPPLFFEISEAGE